MVLAGAGTVIGAAVLWDREQAAIAPEASTVSAPAAPTVRPVPASADAAPPEGGGPGPVVSAADLRARYRDTGARVDEHYRGTRLRLAGPVAAVEDTESGVLVVALAAGDDLPPLRVLVDQPHHAAARRWTAGQAVVVDCLHSGLVMGEPLFSDCRPVPG